MRLLYISNDEACIYRLDSAKDNKGPSQVRLEGYVNRLPLGICDGDIQQLHCLFSPDLSKHLDVDPVTGKWIVREALSGKVFFEIPRTFLSYNPKDKAQVMWQTRFMAWENDRQISLIDVNADPYIHEIIQIPELAN